MSVLVLIKSCQDVSGVCQEFVRSYHDLSGVLVLGRVMLLGTLLGSVGRGSGIGSWDHSFTLCNTGLEGLRFSLHLRPQKSLIVVCAVLWWYVTLGRIDFADLGGRYAGGSSAVSVGLSGIRDVLVFERGPRV